MSDLTLLPEALRQRLAMLTLSPHTARASGIKGERRSTRRGTSIEFADYRNYALGDDLRKLDWNAYARLDRPIVKLYEDEEDLIVHLLLDDSASMGALEEATSEKFAYARQLCAAVGFVALNSGDRVTLTRLSQPSEPIFSGRGRSGVLGLLRTLATLSSAQQVDISAAVRQFLVREKRAGMVFMISDLLVDDAAENGLKALLARRHEVILLHTLTPDEMNPPLLGDVRLLDVETGHAQEVTIDASLHAQYRQSLAEWLQGIRATCTRRGIHYVALTTDTPLEALFLRDLRRAGVLR